MKKALNCLLGISTIFLSGSALAQDGAVTEHAFRELLSRNERELPITSFLLEGEVTFAPSDEFVSMKNVPAASLKNHVLVTSKDDLLKIEFTFGDRTRIDKLRYIIDADSVVQEQLPVTGGPVATITPRAKCPHPAAGYNPMFAAYAFLADELTGEGPPAWTAGNLAEWSTMWKNLLLQVKPDSFKELTKNTCEITFSKPWGGEAIVTFELEGGVLYPILTRVLNEDGSLNFEVEILDYSKDLELGIGLLKKCRTKLYKRIAKTQSFTPGDVVTEVSRIEINPTLTEDDFSFDPASADKILDGASGIMINVPR